MMNKMRKMKNKKGFTLMEMLIVVAIIAILIAIAIPTFASSLNKARVATDEANIRSGYAEVMTEVLLGNFDRLLIELGHLLAQGAHALVHLADFALLCTGAEGENTTHNGQF